MAMDDDAAEGERPVGRAGRVVDALVSDGEAGARVAAQGVDFVSGFGAVEVEFAGFRIVEGIEGDAIGVAAVAGHGEDSAWGGGEDVADFVVGKGLLGAAHGAEGGITRRHGETETRRMASRGGPCDGGGR